MNIDTYYVVKVNEFNYLYWYSDVFHEINPALTPNSRFAKRYSSVEEVYIDLKNIVNEFYHATFSLEHAIILEIKCEISKTIEINKNDNSTRA